MFAENNYEPQTMSVWKKIKFSLVLCVYGFLRSTSI